MPHGMVTSNALQNTLAIIHRSLVRYNSVLASSNKKFAVGNYESIGGTADAALYATTLVEQYLKKKEINVQKSEVALCTIRTLILDRILENTANKNTKIYECVQDKYEELQCGDDFYNNKFASYIDPDQAAWRWLNIYLDSYKYLGPDSYQKYRENIRILKLIVTLLEDPLVTNDSNIEQDIKEHLIQQLSILARGNNFGTRDSDRMSCPNGTLGRLALVFQSHPEFRPQVTQHERVKKQVELLISNMAADEMQYIFDDTISKQEKITAMIKVCESITSIGIHNCRRGEDAGSIQTPTTGTIVTKKLLHFRECLRAKHYRLATDMESAVAALLPDIKLAAEDKAYIISMWQALANEEIRAAVYVRYEQFKEKLDNIDSGLDLVAASLSSYQRLSSSQQALIFNAPIQAVRNQFKSRLTDYLQYLNVTEYESRFSSEDIIGFTDTLNAQIKTLSVVGLENLIKMQLLNSSDKNLIQPVRKRRRVEVEG